VLDKPESVQAVPNGALVSQFYTVRFIVMVIYCVPLLSLCRNLVSNNGLGWLHGFTDLPLPFILFYVLKHATYIIRRQGADHLFYNECSRVLGDTNVFNACLHCYSECSAEMKFGTVHTGNTVHVKSLWKKDNALVEKKISQTCLAEHSN